MRLSLPILVLMLLVSALCARSSIVEAAQLTSTNFTLTTRGVGGANGNVLSSEHFSLITQSGSYTYGTSSDGGGDGDGGTPSEETDVQSGSRVHRRVDTSVTPEFISASQRENIPVQKERVSLILQNKGMEKGKELDVGDTRAFDAVEVGGDAAKPFGASLMDAWLQGGFGSVKEFLHDIFAERSARAVVLFAVLVTLFLVRTYTVVGRKYSPF